VGLVFAASNTSRAITWNPAMTDPAPNTNRNVSTVSFNLAAETRFNGTGIVSVTANAGSGNLISDQWVLTARHVIAGATNGTFFLEGTNRPIAEFHTRVDSDVALVKLASPVTNYPAVPPYQGTNEVNKDVWLVGYGRHGQFTGNPNELTAAFAGRYAAMNRVALVTNLFGTIGNCLQFNYDGTNAGALPLEGATAPGDSGGPMFMEENGRLWVIGETYGVAPPAPGFYHGRVSAYKDWIRTTTGINFNEANWDADPVTPGVQNGAGTWSEASSNWFFGTNNFRWAAGYDVVFGAGTNAVGAVVLATNTAAGDLMFSSNSSAQSLAGTNTLTLKAAALVSNASAVIISLPLTGPGLTKRGAGTLTLSNAAFPGGMVFAGPVVIDETGLRSWTNSLLGTSNWFKAGPGTLTLTASNSFNGFLIISAGAVRAANADALGSATGTVVEGGNAVASLEISNINFAMAEQIQLVMHNQTNTPHAQVRNVSGTNRLTGNVLLNSGGARWDIGSTTGRLVIAGAVSNIASGTAAWRTLHLHGPGSGSFDGRMTDNAAGTDLLNVTAASGDWTLGGPNKTYTGATTVSNGATLRLRASLASVVQVRSGATLAVTVTNWTNSPAAPGAPALAATNGTLWKVRLETAGLTNFSETPATVPILTVTNGFTNITPAAITVETPGFAGSGSWSAVTNSNTLSVSYTPDAYVVWTQGFTWGTASSAPGADPDADGMENLSEYAFGGNPLVASSAPKPVLGRSGDGRFLTLNFTALRADTTYSVRGTATLALSPTNLTSYPGTIGGPVSFTDSVEIGSAPARFLDVLISR
jgi:autotransporter-associated beta strand protein